MKNGTCPKCNSRVIIRDKPIPDRGHLNLIAGFLSLSIKGKSTGWLANHIATGELRAWICGECGYTEFYITNFKELLEADRESKATNK